MAQTIIILDQEGLPSDLNYRVAFWLDVPMARQRFYANAAAVSAFVDATAAELAALKAEHGATTMDQLYLTLVRRQGS